MNSNCLECGCYINPQVFSYSANYFGIPLCIQDQKWILSKKDTTTFEAVQLYFALKERGVPAQLEKYDGFKHIDIAIPEAKVNIEVDGGHHNYNNKQALADLKRTYHSFLKGFFTLRIPNSLVKGHLEETADYITDLLVVNRKRIIAKHSKFQRW
jgi:very-short-patch-repair endonuclease